ncbi:MAG: peptidase [Pirellulaceae bacterium]|nr:peptidase [Pirellulaceae bacterium]
MFSPSSVEPSQSLTNSATTKPSRRSILKATATASILWTCTPFVHAQSKTSSKTIVGQGEYTFELIHQCVSLPAPFHWQITHNVAVDREDNLYVIHEGNKELKEHPSIFVFDAAGKYIRSFAQQFQGGGHGLEVRLENGEEFLYVTGYQDVKMFAKLTLKGDIVWERRVPIESRVYHPDELKEPKNVFARDRFQPTNFAFLDDGGFLLADGYGAWKIHRYDKDARWLSCFGGAGAGQGTFNTPHGLWIDKRDPKNQKIIVADRAHHILQIFDLNGVYLDTLTGFGLPANVDSQGELILVPELVARVTLLGKDNQVVAHFGEDVARISADKKKAIRGDETQWQDGKFVHPHDACFDSQGNIFVAEWVSTGRISKLRKV